MSLSDFTVEKKLGAGSFGSVFKVRRKTDSKIYAMKRVDISHMSKREIADGLTEVRILASVRHRNVVSFLEAFVERGRELIMVLDFCDGGDLAMQIDLHRRNRRYIPEAKLWDYLIQLVDGLGCLHDMKIVHRDLKPANAFLTSKGEVRIGDLNVSKIAKNDVELRTQIGTPYYMAPEIWADQPYTKSCDLWALGCCLYELACLKPPFDSRSIAGLGKAVRLGKFEPIPKIFSTTLREVIASLLAVKASSRPTCKALAASPAFTERRKKEHEESDEEEDEAPQGKLKIDLLKTIKVPHSVHLLTNALPKACYPDTRPNSPVAWPATNQRRAEAIVEKQSSERRSSFNRSDSDRDALFLKRGQRQPAVKFLSSSRDPPPSPPVSPKSPLPIRGGNVNHLLRNAQREARRGPREPERPVQQPYAPPPNRRPSASRYQQPASYQQQPQQRQQPASYQQQQQRQQPRSIYSKNQQQERPLPSLVPSSQAAKIQAVLRGSRTRRQLAARVNDEAARRQKQQAALRRHAAPDWWG